MNKCIACEGNVHRFFLFFIFSELSLWCWYFDMTFNTVATQEEDCVRILRGGNICIYHVSTSSYFLSNKWSHGG